MATNSSVRGAIQSIRPFQFRLVTLTHCVSACAVTIGAGRQWGLAGIVTAIFLLAGVIAIWRANSWWLAAENCLFVLSVFGVTWMFLDHTCRYCVQVRPHVRCMVNLREIGIALLKYENHKGYFPPACFVDAQRRPLHSWRTLLLKELGYRELYEKIRFDEPWNSPHNSQFHNEVVDVFFCPSDVTKRNWKKLPVMTSYVAVIGKNTAWRGDGRVSKDDIIDDHQVTVLLVEIANSGIHWMEPRDLHLDQMAPTINSTTGKGISSHHRDGPMAFFVDGSVRQLPVSTKATTLGKGLVVNDGPVKPKEQPKWKSLRPGSDGPLFRERQSTGNGGVGI